MEKMEEISSLKRQREEQKPQVVEEHEEDVYKRQKSYKDIITLLEKDEDEPNDDVSSLISTLQEEILASCSDLVEPGYGELDRVCSGSIESGSGGEEEGVEEVMRHLLEASDDELGLPNTSGNNSGTEMDSCDLVVGGQVDGGDLFLPVGEGLWEFEDHEANNCYSFLQSEIFM